MRQTGIDNPETFDNSASYIANWLTALNNNNKLVITAAAQAQRALRPDQPGRTRASQKH